MCIQPPHPPFTRLDPFEPNSEVVNVIVDTPKGSRNKFKFDEVHGLFRLASVLPAGCVFPYDFGYIPGTLAPDGDPLDILLLMDSPAFTGCLVPARLIGVIEAEQTDEDAMVRNDRLIAVAANARTYDAIREVSDLNAQLLGEIEHFFVSYNEMRGMQCKLLHRRGPSEAQRIVHSCARDAAKKQTQKHDE